MFELPASVVLLFRTLPDRVIVHNLDFNLTCEGKTQREARDKIHLATKAHVEYGLKHGLGEFISRAAPAELWDLIPEARIMGDQETIWTDDNERIVASSSELKQVSAMA